MKQRGVFKSLAILATVSALGLTGCDTVKSELGLIKEAPDEFTVIEKAPLALPPDFKLRPPRPGATRPTYVEQHEKARSDLFGTELRANGSNILAGRGSADGPQSQISRGEREFLSQAGADEANPEIRKIIKAEMDAYIKKDEDLVNKVLFWEDRPGFGETIVDARKEQNRLQEALILGDKVDGAETPEIERKKRTFLEGIRQ